MSERGVDALRAIELGVRDLEATARFYEEVWGLRPVARDGESRYFRASGPEQYVLALHRRDRNAALRATLSAPDRESVDLLFKRVLDAGAEMVSKPAALTTPGAGYGFAFRDPEGREFRVAAAVQSHADVTHAVDRPYKLSHVVFNALDHVRSAEFFTGVLGFRQRDRTRKAIFLGCNADHHCLAFTDRKNTALSHAAFELPSLDAVLRGCGRLKKAGMKIEWGVGRHGTGNNVFAYFIDPNDFVIEYTGEMEQVDDATYVPGTPETIARAAHSDLWGLAEPPSARFLAAVAGDTVNA